MFSELSLSVITQYVHGVSALMAAAREGGTEIISLLLEAGAIKVKFLLTTRCGLENFIIPNYHCPSSHSMSVKNLH